MRNNENITRPKFVKSTLEVFSDELFAIHSIAETQDALDHVTQLVLLSEEYPLLQKQVWWQSYKHLKITLHSFQTKQHPEFITDIPVCFSM